MKRVRCGIDSKYIFMFMFDKTLYSPVQVKHDFAKLTTPVQSSVASLTTSKPGELGSIRSSPASSNSSQPSEIG